MTNREQILGFLAVSAGPQSTIAIWQALNRRGVQIRQDEVGAVLQQMASAGDVERVGAAWRGLKAEMAKAPTGRPNIGGIVATVTTTGRAASAPTPIIQPDPLPAAGRWRTFRQL